MHTNITQDRTVRKPPLSKEYLLLVKALGHNTYLWMAIHNQVLISFLTVVLRILLFAAPTGISPKYPIFIKGLRELL